MSNNTKKNQINISVGIILALVVGFYVFQAAKAMPTILHDYGFNSSYFGSDVARVWNNLTDRYSDHHRTSVHPLFSLFVSLPCLFAHKFLGLEKLTAVSLLLAINASALTSVMYYLLFFVTKRLLDTVLFLALFLLSMSFLMWSRVPETFPFGATSMLVPFIIITIPRIREKENIQIISSIVTMGITITNWMSGILGCFFVLRYKKTFIVIVKAFVLVLALWSIQKYIYPSAGHVFNLTGEKKYVLSRKSEFTARQIFLDSMSPSTIEPEYSDVMERPTVVVTKKLPDTDGLQLMGFWFLWILLLIVGAFHCMKSRKESPLNILLLAFVAGQVILHNLYGIGETFMYSIHWMPSLVLVAAFSSKSRYRPVILIVVLIMVFFIGPRNKMLVAKSLSISKSFENELSSEERKK